MATRRPPRRQDSGGRGIFLIIALVLAAGVIKYTDTPFARAVRLKATEVLAGAPSFDEVLSVIGCASLEDASAVFRAQMDGTQPDGTQSDETQTNRIQLGGTSISSTPANSTQSSGTQGNDTPASGTSADGQELYAASSGGADDILGREKTLFPDSVDQTIYPMTFEHKVPVVGTQTSDFGSRLSPITGQPGFHYGLDLAADEGVSIGAFADGTVREIGESSYGKYLILDHEDGFSTLYAHCSSISATVGQSVECGEEIALVGQTGNATGPHLHLEIWKDGAALDPANYLTDL